MSKAQRRSQSGKESIEGKTNDVGCKSNHHDVDLDILYGQIESVEDALLFQVLISLSNILNNTQLCNLSLLLCETT
jgi:hypothetical protein